MTENRYQLAQNMRTVGLTLNVVLLVLIGFLMFDNGEVTGLNIITLVAAVINCVYFVINKPLHKPENKDEQIPGKTPDTKQDQI
jgi:hypothetical protein